MEIDLSISEFIERINLKPGYYKKPVDLFYHWYIILTPEDRTVSLVKFREAFNNEPWVFFNINNIDKVELRKVTLDYEKKKLRRFKKKTQIIKSKI